MTWDWEEGGEEGEGEEGGEGEEEREEGEAKHNLSDHFERR